MKGVVFLGNRRCDVRDFPIGEPGHGEVLLRIMATGICGSDLHVYRSATASDQIRGHEPCGLVESVGPGIVRLQPGDRVTVQHHQGCGVCYDCLQGETVPCKHNKTLFGVSTPGSFAEFTVAKERNCIPLADSMSFADGAFLACVGGTAYGALRRLQTTPYETLAVFGLGPVGLSCVLVAKTLGLRVAGVDVLPERVRLAETCGADLAIDAAAENVVDAVRAFSGNGVDHIIETSGSTDARRCILPSLRRGGKAAIVGVGSTEAVINPSDIHGRAATLIGSVVFPIHWGWDLVELCRRSGLTFEPAVTHRLPLERGVEALQLADEGHCGKVLFIPEHQ